MEGKLGLGRLLRWGRVRPAAPTPDAADAGTTFGMELALEAEQRANADIPFDEDEPPAPAAPRTQRGLR